MPTTAERFVRRWTSAALIPMLWLEETLRPYAIVSAACEGNHSRLAADHAAGGACPGVCCSV
eukprot:766328-Hanusia_phi.AAC.7